MKVEYVCYDGDVEFTGESKFYGIIKGSVKVLDGAVIRFNGMVEKNLTVEQGGYAVINGMVKGNVINDGGKLEIYGYIKGVVKELSGKTYIDLKSCIGNDVID